MSITLKPERGAVDLQLLLEKLYRREDLTQQESTAVFEQLVRGELSELEIAALLVALKTKGEGPAELSGAALALRRAAAPFPCPHFAYADTCGTGGDGARSLNISTAAALVAAEAGVPVAKHGNRSISSQCGSADVLEAAGVRIEVPPDLARRCLEELGICFLFAPQYHAGMRHAMPVRRSLRTRTIFNLLGPLSNPSAPTWQVLGVYDPAWCRPLAETLGLLGCRTALVVHGNGLDELALHGPTRAALWQDGQVRELVLSPEDAGLKRYPQAEMTGGTPRENADWLWELLAGHGSEAHQAMVALNAGALLWIAGRAPNLAAGTAQARRILGSGAAAQRLQRFVEMTNCA